MTVKMKAIVAICCVYVTTGLAPTLNAKQAQRLTGKLVDITWIKDLDSGETIRVKEYGKEEMPIFGKLSPDGRLIWFNCEITKPDGKRFYELRLINSDGSNERVIFSASDYFTAGWSPDSQFLLLSVPNFQGRVILAADLKRAWKVDLPDASLQDIGTSFWLKDGKTILFRDTPALRGIYRMSLDGSEFKKVMDLPQGVESLELSPDENKLVTASGDLFVLDLLAKHTVHLAKTRFVETNPVWSPDGEWVGYERSGTTPSLNDEWFARNLKSGKTIRLGIKGHFGIQWWGPLTEPAPNCEEIIKNLLGKKEIDIKLIQESFDK